MISWMSRPAEERALLNPGFCSCLLWQAATGYESVSRVPFPFDVAFLVLPLVLHRGTREALPKALTTSLAVWLNDNPLSRSGVGERARILAPFTKEAIMFGGIYGLLDLGSGTVAANGNWRRPVTADLRHSTDEVRDCARRAEFVGRWFARAGSPSTVMAVFGVKP